MKIYGLQKLTLIDYPGRLACTVFTGGCNYKCPFCHNSTLVINPDDTSSMGESELFTFLKKRKGILEGVCVSGGEPLLQPKLESFLYKIKELGFAIKLDTNGSFPEKLKHIIENGLVDYVAMDIKNSLQNYARTIGFDHYDTSSIISSVNYLQSHPIPHEFRTTVVRELHAMDDLISIGEWIKGTSPYYLQTFIDSEHVMESGYSGYTKQEMLEFKDILLKYISSVTVREI